MRRWIHTQPGCRAHKASMKIWLSAVVFTVSLALNCARAEDKQLNIYNWADYIGKNTIAKFEQATGIKVVYDTFDADTMLEAKVMAGGSDYDVVTTSTDFFSRQIKAGVYMALDKKKLPNWKNLDPHILAIEAGFDPGNMHAVPYMHSINGFAYNVDMIKARMPNAPLDSLDMLFKPEVIAKFADCGVSFLDSAEDVLQLALNYLHLDPNTTQPQDFKAAERLILAVRPYIRSFDSSEYMNGLANKEVCIAMSFSADYAASRARAQAAGVDALIGLLGAFLLLAVAGWILGRWPARRVARGPRVLRRRGAGADTHPQPPGPSQRLHRRLLPRPSRRARSR